MSTQPRIAIVTGASRGLGRNTALHLAEKGIDLLITYRSNAAEAESVVTAAKELGRHAVAFQLDTGDVRTFDGFVADVRRALEQTWGRDSFDFLVNNAGIGIDAAFVDTTEDAFDQLMNVHVKGSTF